MRPATLSNNMVVPAASATEAKNKIHLKSCIPPLSINDSLSPLGYTPCRIVKIVRMKYPQQFSFWVGRDFGCVAIAGNTSTNFQLRCLVAMLGDTPP